ncbi:MAG: DUF3018 family protein [Rhizobiales bacterium]|nr:DUF3018 family protein [Hyphomicrobiales bacterium]
MGRPRELSPEEREDLLRRGYRPVEIWVPDISSEAYKAEAARQTKAAVEADRQAGIVELIGEDLTDDWEKP